MNKLFNGSEFDTHTIVLDSGVDICCENSNNLDKKKFRKDADCCFDAHEKVMFDKCQDKKEKTIGPLRLNCQARLLKINILLKKACKGRKVAIGILIMDDKKTLGFKGTEIVVPGELGRGCTDVKINNFCFVLPEKSICDRRKVEVKVIAHYAGLSRKDDSDC